MKFKPTPTLLLAVVLLLGLPSCVSYKEMVLMNANENEATIDKIRSHKVIKEGPLAPFSPYTIQPFDQLMIRINAFDGSTEDFINREFTAQTDNGGFMEYNPASLYFNSYTVDKDGNIALPMLEQINVTGMTLKELKQLLDKQYKPFLKFASSNVKLANMRVTVLGEVNTPGVHYLYNEKNTLLDAISLAGDYTDFANLKKVKLIRQTDRGAKTVFLNLNKPDFVYSEFYYIAPYDVIYIEPIKARSLDSSSNVLGVVLSAVSIAVLLANIFIDNRP
ncbi:MAG: polysaccharide biosynthesis/export family protein [Bacteroidota bacterium]